MARETQNGQSAQDQARLSARMEEIARAAFKNLCEQAARVIHSHLAPIFLYHHMEEAERTVLLYALGNPVSSTEELARAIEADPSFPAHLRPKESDSIEQLFRYALVSLGLELGEMSRTESDRLARVRRHIHVAIKELCAAHDIDLVHWRVGKYAAQAFQIVERKLLHDPATQSSRLPELMAVLAAFMATNTSAGIAPLKKLIAEWEKPQATDAAQHRNTDFAVTLETLTAQRDVAQENLEAHDEWCPRTVQPFWPRSNAKVQRHFAGEPTAPPPVPQQLQSQAQQARSIPRVVTAHGKKFSIPYLQVRLEQRWAKRTGARTVLCATPPEIFWINGDQKLRAVWEDLCGRRIVYNLWTLCVILERGATKEDIYRIVAEAGHAVEDAEDTWRIYCHLESLGFVKTIRYEGQHQNPERRLVPENILEYIRNAFQAWARTYETS